MSGERQFCTFTVGDGYFGVDVMRVQEIVRRREMTIVPLAPPVIHGLINLRGQIVTAIDLRGRLGMNVRTPDESVVNVVVTTEDGAISLQADEIGDVLAVAEVGFEPPPETCQGAASTFSFGVYKLPDRLLIVLDVDKIIAVETNQKTPI